MIMSKIIDLKLNTDVDSGMSDVFGIAENRATQLWKGGYEGFHSDLINKAKRLDAALKTADPKNIQELCYMLYMLGQLEGEEL